MTNVASPSNLHMLIEETVTLRKEVEALENSLARFLAQFIQAAHTPTLNLVSDVSNGTNGKGPNGTNGSTTVKKRNRSKPKDTPSVPEMIRSVLAESKEGMTIKDIVTRVKKQFWPGLVPRQIAPTIYRLTKEGKFIKDGKMFLLLPDHSAA